MVYKNKSNFKNIINNEIKKLSDKVEKAEDKIVDIVVEFEVHKNDFANDIVNNGFHCNEIERTLNYVKKNLHLNVMCLDDDIEKLNIKMKKTEYKLYTLYFLLCIFYLINFLG